jgi:NitT/TauT family transport system ATP-binding protein
MAANPGRILTVVDNRLPRPRDYRNADLLALVDRLHDIITGHELPDVPPGAPRVGVPSMEALPEAKSSEIVGLLEYLDARGGKEEVFRIAAETRRQFDQMLAIVEAAELLEFVDTPKRMVVLDAAGKRYLQADPEQRKAIWREQLLKLRLFREVYEALQREPRHELSDEFVKENIIMHMPHENYEKVFETFIRWARFGNLLAYDEDTGTISLQDV